MVGGGLSGRLSLTWSAAGPDCGLSSACGDRLRLDRPRMCWPTTSVRYRLGRADFHRPPTCWPTTCCSTDRAICVNLVVGGETRGRWRLEWSAVGPERGSSPACGDRLHRYRPRMCWPTTSVRYRLSRADFHRLLVARRTTCCPIDRWGAALVRPRVARRTTCCWTDRGIRAILAVEGATSGRWRLEWSAEVGVVDPGEGNADPGGGAPSPGEGECARRTREENS